MLLAFLAVLGCGFQSPERPEDYLIRLGDLKVTHQDFLQAFELTKTAYPGAVNPDAPELQQARHQLLNEMTLDLILLKRSQQLGISISPVELDAAVAAVKADYPPGVFEQTLIEIAVPLEAWKQRLRCRLLMDKMVDAEVRPRVTITAEELTAYYEQNYGGKAAAADSEFKFEQLKETLVADLRRAKTEEALSAWINGLMKEYPVEINSALWTRIMESEPQVPTPKTDGADSRK